jgi:hypothetical protein
VVRQVARDSIEKYDSLASGVAAAMNHCLAIEGRADNISRP